MLDSRRALATTSTFYMAVSGYTCCSIASLLYTCFAICEAADGWPAIAIPVHVSALVRTAVKAVALTVASLMYCSAVSAEANIIFAIVDDCLMFDDCLMHRSVKKWRNQ